MDRRLEFPNAGGYEVGSLSTKKKRSNEETQPFTRRLEKDEGRVDTGT